MLIANKFGKAILQSEEVDEWEQLRDYCYDGVSRFDHWWR